MVARPAGITVQSAICPKVAVPIADINRTADIRGGAGQGAPQPVLPFSRAPIGWSAWGTR